MKGKKQNENTSLSAGQLRRLERKKEAERQRRKAKLAKIISYSVLGVICVCLITTIGYSIYRNITSIKPSSDYSAYLNDDGLIKDVTAKDLVKLPDYKNITVPLKEVEYTDESLEADIKTLVDNYKELSKDTDAAIQDGDKVNIDYVGTIDGKEFSGGNSNGEGHDLTIGSDDFIDGFEDQLIGHKVGDKVTVNVTFPENYSNSSVAGKDAVFDVTINGIYVAPEFTDDFVKEHLSEYASTADEYKAYLKETKYNTNLENWIVDYLLKNTTVTSYPTEYYNHLKSLRKHEDQSGYEYMKSLYASISPNQKYTFKQYVGMSEAKYDANLGEMVKDDATKALAYQAIYETEGLSASKDDYATYFDADTTSFDTLAKQKGTGAVMQQIIQKKVLEYIKGLVKVQ